MLGDMICLSSSYDFDGCEGVILDYRYYLFSVFSLERFVLSIKSENEVW